MLKTFGEIVNAKPTKSITASSFISAKKAFTVIREDGENQTQTQLPYQLILFGKECYNNKGISNVGGPGTLNGSGLDKKHGSYERYLARKVGWNIKRQYCKQ